MGRHTKTVLQQDGLDRRANGYYATPRFVADYIAQTLVSINPSGSQVLDPCIGQGEMTEPFYDLGKDVEGFDVTDFDVKHKLNFHQKDFLEYVMQSSNEPLFFKHHNADYIVANPPYNCHESDYIRRNKTRLTQYFGKSAGLNMYSMFIKAMLYIAKPGCLLGLVTLDSFLTSHWHAPLRDFILKHCHIHRLHLCPSDLFRDQKADVRTCIIVLEKQGVGKLETYVSNRPTSRDDFKTLLKRQDFNSVKATDLVLNHAEDNNEFVIGAPREVLDIFKNRRLSSVFPCITGISTGNDKKYLSKQKKHGQTIPFYKNPGTRRFFMEPDAYLPDNFLETARAVPNFMVRNRKYLFSGGIACSSMGVSFGAAYLPDGATVGVNPNIIVDGEDRWWLLAYLNSSLCTYIVRGVMLRTNMITAGYVARIPVPPISENTKASLAEVARSAYEKKKGGGDTRLSVLQIDALINKDLGFEKQTAFEIQEFADDVIRKT